MLRGTKICTSLLYNYLTSESEIIETGPNQSSTKINKLKCLTDTFSSYGGVLSKISQLLCLEDENNSVFSDCKPYSRDETIKYLKHLYTTELDFFKNVSSIDFEPFKSGSVGQVHKAIYKNKDIIIKVQYVGLEEQVKTDLCILDNLIKYLYNTDNLANAIIDIRNKFDNELNYNTEYINQENMYNLWNNHDDIRIAKLIPQLSNKTLLAMHYIHSSESLNSFIETSTQDEKNKIGKLIIEFIFTNLYKYGMLYSDIHYGNFLVKNKKKLYVMDFGQIDYLDDKTLKNFKNLHLSVIDDNPELFYESVTNLGALNNSVSKASREYFYEYFKIQFKPYTDKHFNFNKEWISKTGLKNTDLMKEWELPQNMVYLNKLIYGLPHVCVKLNISGNFRDLLKNILS